MVNPPTYRQQMERMQILDSPPPTPPPVVQIAIEEAQDIYQVKEITQIWGRGRNTKYDLIWTNGEVGTDVSASDVFCPDLVKAYWVKVKRGKRQREREMRNRRVTRSCGRR